MPGKNIVLFTAGLPQDRLPQDRLPQDRLPPVKLLVYGRILKDHSP